MVCLLYIIDLPHREPIPCWSAVFTFFQDRHTNKPTQVTGILKVKHEPGVRLADPSESGAPRPSWWFATSNVLLQSLFANTTQEVGIRL